MKEVSLQIYNAFNMKDLKIDFMGYYFGKKDNLSFHHLITPKRSGGLESFENGALLVRQTSHDYLHTIERMDFEIFELITKEIILEKYNKKIDLYNLKRIRSLLEYFENEYKNEKFKNGKKIIKQEYIRKRVN